MEKFYPDEPENNELITRDELQAALKQYTQNINIGHLRAVHGGTVSASEAEKCAAKALLECIEAAGSELARNALQRAHMYSVAIEPVSEIYSNAHDNPERPCFPTKPEDVYGCRAVIRAFELAGLNL